MKLFPSNQGNASCEIFLGRCHQQYYEAPVSEPSRMSADPMRPAQFHRAAFLRHYRRYLSDSGRYLLVRSDESYSSLRASRSYKRGTMDDLDKEIRRLAGKIRALEQMLVEICGVPPLATELAPGLGVACARWLRPAFRHLWRWLVHVSERAIPAPQPD